MPEDIRQLNWIHPAAQRLGGEAVAEKMGVDPFLDLCLVAEAVGCAGAEPVAVHVTKGTDARA